MKKNLFVVLLAIVGSLSAMGIAEAQVAGSTAIGWSAKKSILGKAVYNDSGVKIGKVEDLIIAPDRNVSYVIVGAGGFIGFGRHDVAIEMSQIQEQDGRIVMPGATKESLQSMPPFEYASNAAQREKFLAATEKNIVLAKEKIAEIQTRAAVATSDAKTRLDVQAANAQQELKTAEGKLLEMKRASENRWREFERDVVEAMARVRKSIAAATE